MLDFSILFKIGGCGIILLVLDQILKSGKKDDVATIINIAGIAIILVMVLSIVGDLFNTVKTMFMF